MTLNLRLACRLFFGSLAAGIALGLPLVTAVAQSSEPSAAALGVAAAVRAAQEQAAADGLPLDEAAAAIAVALEAAVPAGLSNEQIAALLDEVVALLGANITPAMSIAVSVVREDRGLNTPETPGAGPTAARPAIPVAGTPPPGSNGDDTQTDPGYQPPQ